MEYRTFGRSGMKVSVLGFGCGAVGGFMVRGDHAEQERTVARAIEAGVNYFDTAVQYGDGESEKNVVGGTTSLGWRGKRRRLRDNGKSGTDGNEVVNPVAESAETTEFRFSR